jgi:hypothetical protein
VILVYKERRVLVVFLDYLVYQGLMDLLDQRAIEDGWEIQVRLGLEKKDPKDQEVLQDLWDHKELENLVFRVGEVLQGSMVDAGLLVVLDQLDHPDTVSSVMRLRCKQIGDPARKDLELQEAFLFDFEKGGDKTVIMNIFCLIFTLFFLQDTAFIE